MNKNDLLSIFLAIVVFAAGRTFYEWFDPQLRGGFFSFLREPHLDPEAERMGLLLMLAGVIIVFVLLKACPFPHFE
jgi:hypothetical protein